MWKVIIADDEKEARLYLKNLIHWPDYGCILVGEARNGKEALELVKQHEPHIVITDIMMPVMDGIELLTEARKQKMDCKFVMLTCMNEFEYARQAIEYGASSYLLKLSMSKFSLLDVLDKLKGELVEQVRVKKIQRYMNAVSYEVEERYTDHAEINKVIDYIAKHYKDDVTLSGMAEYVRMDASYLSDIFKKKTGHSLIHHLQKVRIEAAQFYLKGMDYTVSQIGEMVGFQNDNYFIKIFKRWTGTTPSEYRKQVKR